jgi:transcriptional regulator with XRE-family HTH domain
MTLDEVADRAGFSKSHVWEMEKGRGRDVTVRAVRALARCFGVSVVTFLEDGDFGPALHPEAMRIAIQVDEALRKAGAAHG